MTDALAQNHLHATLTECVRIFPSVIRGGDGSRVLEFPGHRCCECLAVGHATIDHCHQTNAFGPTAFAVY